MGTYEQSRFSKARRNLVCVECALEIPTGQPYLRYARGWRQRDPVCYGCCLKLGPNGLPKFSCRCVDELIKFNLEQEETF